MYQDGLGGAFSAERALKTAHREYIVLSEFQPFASASRDTAQSPDCPSSLPQQSFKDFLKLKRLRPREE